MTTTDTKKDTPLLSDGDHMDVYTKDGCNFCDLAAKVLDIQGIDYTLIPIDDNQELIEFVKKEWSKKGFNQPTVPLIINRTTGEVIGGFNDITAYLTA